ncbi:MAG: hypothetical protein WDM89_07425 [Rhizomicrobium sp.]
MIGRHGGRELRRCLKRCQSTLHIPQSLVGDTNAVMRLGIARIDRQDLFESPLCILRMVKRLQTRAKADLSFHIRPRFQNNSKLGRGVFDAPYFQQGVREIEASGRIIRLESNRMLKLCDRIQITVQASQYVTQIVPHNRILRRQSRRSPKRDKRFFDMTQCVQCDTQIALCVRTGRIDRYGSR